MKTRATWLSLTLILAFASSPIVSAQGVLQDWNGVRAIRTGTELIVETRDGKSIKGKLSSVTDSALNLTHGGKSDAIDQKIVRSIYLTKKGSRIKSALIGVGTGVAIGVGISVVIGLTNRGEDASFAAAAGILYGVPAGAVIGAVMGGKTRKGRLIYEAK